MPMSKSRLLLAVLSLGCLISCSSGKTSAKGSGSACQGQSDCKPTEVCIVGYDATAYCAAKCDGSTPQANQGSGTSSGSVMPVCSAGLICCNVSTPECADCDVITWACVNKC